MSDVAAAVEITEANYQAILSESGSSFDKGFLYDWVAKNGTGYFIRDVRDDVPSPMDCLLLVPEDFHKMYRFLPIKLDEEGVNHHALFQRIARA